jgi:hypothetical protein
MACTLEIPGLTENALWCNLILHVGYPGVSFLSKLQCGHSKHVSGLTAEASLELHGGYYCTILLLASENAGYDRSIVAQWQLGDFFNELLVSTATAAFEHNPLGGLQLTACSLGPRGKRWSNAI